MPFSLDSLRDLRDRLRDQQPESAELLKEAIQYIVNLEVALATSQHELGRAVRTLEKYADPVFWLRLPPSTFAAVDKGQAARTALRDINPTGVEDETV